MVEVEAVRWFEEDEMVIAVGLNGEIAGELVYE
jgi:hypothetical protein